MPSFQFISTGFHTKFGKGVAVEFDRIDDEMRADMSLPESRTEYYANWVNRVGWSLQSIGEKLFEHLEIPEKDRFEEDHEYIDALA